MTVFRELAILVQEPVPQLIGKVTQQLRSSSVAPAREVSFTTLAGVDVHYDRDLGAYGTRGRPYVFKCQARLRDALEACFEELFKLLPEGKPNLITSAGTIGDGENAHGLGLAFDLDGLFWDNTSFVVRDFFVQKYLYLGVNAHLFRHFPQVLNYYYPQHDDHFHVDFNFSFRYRPESNAQTYFLQASLKYVFDEELGRHGIHRDGVDGVHGEATRRALGRVLAALPLKTKGGLTTKDGWFEFLEHARQRAFDRAAHDSSPTVPVARASAVFPAGFADEVDSFLAGRGSRFLHGAAAAATATAPRAADPADDIARCVCSVLVSARKPCLASKAPSQIGYNDSNVWLGDGRDMVRCLQKRRGYTKLAVDSADILAHFDKPVGDFQDFLLKKIRAR
jgi:hypothetical protein